MLVHLGRIPITTRLVVAWFAQDIQNGRVVVLATRRTAASCRDSPCLQRPSPKSRLFLNHLSARQTASLSCIQSAMRSKFKDEHPFGLSGSATSLFTMLTPCTIYREAQSRSGTHQTKVSGSHPSVCPLLIVSWRHINALCVWLGYLRESRPNRYPDHRQEEVPRSICALQTWPPLITLA